MADAKQSNELRVMVHDGLAGERWLRPALIVVGGDKTIYVDFPDLDEETKREFYKVVAHQISWLYPEVRTAARHALGEKDVKQADAVKSKLITEAYRTTIAALKKAGDPRPYRTLAKRLQPTEPGLKASALRQRLKLKR